MSLKEVSVKTKWLRLSSLEILNFSSRPASEEAVHTFSRFTRVTHGDPSDALMGDFSQLSLSSQVVHSWQLTETDRSQVFFPFLMFSGNSDGDLGCTT